MTIIYYFGKNEQEYEYDADYKEVMKIVDKALEDDGYDDYDQINDDLIDEYIDLCMEEILDYFYEEAYQEWKESKMSAYEYYGLNERDYY